MFGKEMPLPLHKKITGRSGIGYFFIFISREEPFFELPPEHEQALPHSMLHKEVFTMLLSVLLSCLGGLFMTGQLQDSCFPKPLSHEEEERYVELMMEGDRAARNILIEHNLRLVAHIVKKYADVSGADDLISIGTIGLIKGVNSFDPVKSHKLSTYISRCIENEILMSLRKEKKYQGQVSLQEPIGFDSDGNEISLIDVLQADNEEICEQIDRENLIAKVMRKVRTLLTDREREIIALRYGLTGEAPLTQREVAGKLGISRSYVSRIEKKALSRLREE